MIRTVIVDYGLCNIDSVARAVEECGGTPVVSGDPAQLDGAERIILPGVGNFAEGASALRTLGWDKALKDNMVNRGAPLLGICLGMQLLASRGEEGGDNPGLGLIGGSVVRMRTDDPRVRIPHVGWNEVEQVTSSPLLDGIENRKDFYFVHSYHFVPESAADIIATTPYCGGIVSMVGRGNVFGTQFHPEKSLRFGLLMLENFLTRA